MSQKIDCRACSGTGREPETSGTKTCGYCMGSGKQRTTDVLKTPADPRRYTIRDTESNVVAGLANVERGNALVCRIVTDAGTSVDTMNVGDIVTGCDRIGERYWIERVA